MNTRDVALTAMGVASAGGFLKGVVDNDWNLRMVTKPIPVAAMAWSLWKDRRDPFDARVAAGLAACVVGDVCLEIGDETFAAGVAAFLVGHVFYAAAFARDGDGLHPGTAAVCYGVGAAIVVSLWDKIPTELRLGIAIYASAICTMLWRAAARAQNNGESGSAGLFGAAAFVVSDALIGFTRFRKGGGIATRFAIILLYWIGQLGIARAARARTLT